MKEIIKAGGYVATATVSRIESSKDFLLKIESKYAHAKEPGEAHSVAGVICEEWGLKALSEEIQEALRRGA